LLSMNGLASLGLQAPFPKPPARQGGFAVRPVLTEARDRRLPGPWLASVCFMQLSLLGQTYAPRSFVWMKLPCQVWYQT